MGLFGSDDEPDIVSRARGDSVTEPRLFEQSGRILNRLNQKAIGEYLHADEQPHYIFQGPSTGLEINSNTDLDGVSPDNSYHAFLVVTDERVLTLAGTSNGDETLGFHFDEIRNVRLQTSPTKFKIRFGTKAGMCTFHSTKKKIDEDEAKAAVEYIRSQIPTESEALEDPAELQDKIDSHDGNGDTSSRSSRHIASDSGSTVTKERVDTIAEYLRNKEKVNHLLRVPSVHHGPDADTKSMVTKFTKTGTAAFTDDRVVIRIPHQMADDQFTIRYKNIENVAYNVEGLSGQRGFELTTPGEQYRIGVHYKIDDEEVREILDWVDEQAANASSTPATPEPPDVEQSPKDRLEELAKLRDEGLITEDEFEAKRAEILDEL